MDVYTIFVEYTVVSPSCVDRIIHNLALELYFYKNGGRSVTSVHMQIHLRAYSSIVYVWIFPL